MTRTMKDEIFERLARLEQDQKHMVKAMSDLITRLTILEARTHAAERESSWLDEPIEPIQRVAAPQPPRSREPRPRDIVKAKHPNALAIWSDAEKERLFALYTEMRAREPNLTTWRVAVRVSGVLGRPHTGIYNQLLKLGAPRDGSSPGVRAMREAVRRKQAASYPGTNGSHGPTPPRK